MSSKGRIISVNFACKVCEKPVEVTGIKCDTCGKREKGIRDDDTFKASIETIKNKEAIICDICREQIPKAGRFLLFHPYFRPTSPDFVPPVICRRCVSRAYFELWK